MSYIHVCGALHREVSACVAKFVSKPTKNHTRRPAGHPTSPPNDRPTTNPLSTTSPPPSHPHPFQVGKPHHAKAGNLNNAIMNEGTSGQFLLIFDCDMVAEPHFLEALLPHFYARVGEDKYAVDKVSFVGASSWYTCV